MEQKIRTVLKRIHSELRTATDPDLSLYGGHAGWALFHYHYLSAFPEENDSDFFSPALQQLAEETLSFPIHSFARGTAGINWLFLHLHKSNILDADDLNLMLTDDAKMMDIALATMRYGNYDFLHGAVGIAWYFLARESTDPIRIFLENFLAILETKFYPESRAVLIPDMDMMTGRFEPGITNIGLSHGIPSILKFCAQCYRQGVSPLLSRRLAQTVLDFLLEHVNTDTLNNFFCNRVDTRTPGPPYSRLAWCYGDLGIAAVLLQVAADLGLPGLASFAVDILEKSTQRRTAEETAVKDAGFCHGAAGIAYIYRKAWRITGALQFREAGEYWVRYTLGLERDTAEPASFQKYDPIKNQYTPCYSLLEGSAGVGMALLSFLTEDLSWDYCLMLNE